MRLHEASAVFLIIGGVLLGPIEARLQQQCLPESAGGPKHSGGYYNMENCLDRETTAETCARAMREIGAQHVTDYTKNDPGGARLLAGQSSDDLGEHIDPAKSGWFLGGQPVLCLPAPTGLVR